LEESRRGGLSFSYRFLAKKGQRVLRKRAGEKDPKTEKKENYFRKKGFSPLPTSSRPTMYSYLPQKAPTGGKVRLRHPEKDGFEGPQTKRRAEKKGK